MFLKLSIIKTGLIKKIKLTNYQISKICKKFKIKLDINCNQTKNEQGGCLITFIILIVLMIQKIYKNKRQ